MGFEVRRWNHPTNDRTITYLLKSILLIRRNDILNLSLITREVLYGIFNCTRRGWWINCRCSHVHCLKRGLPGQIIGAIEILERCQSFFKPYISFRSARRLEKPFVRLSMVSLFVTLGKCFPIREWEAKNLSAWSPCALIELERVGRAI